MRQILSIMILVAFASISNISACAESVNQPPMFNPYMPGELNEYSLYVLQEGDVATARILLERAYKLNPLSPDIKHNLEIVRALYQGNETPKIEGSVQSFSVVPESNLLNQTIPEELVDPWANQ